MTLATAIVIAVIAVIFSGLFSGTEIAFVQSNKVKVQIDATTGGPVNRVLQLFSRNEDMFISTILVGNNIVLVVYGIAFSALINPILEGWFNSNEALVLVTNTLLSTGVILIAGEFLPKATFKINPNNMMRIMALPIYIIYVLLYPIAKFTSWISRGLMRMCGIHEESQSGQRLTMNELDDYIQQQMDDTDQSAEVENEVKIFRNAIDFKDTRIAACMIPRNEIVSVDIDTTSREQLLKLFIATGLSKIVVYRHDIDDVQGYIHISEMFNAGSDWREKLKPVIFTPESMLANTLMRRMLSEKRSLAIVVDEFGGTAGLATLEDLVEEIFGEIEDEHDRNRVVMRQTGEGTYEFSGRAEIEAINEEYRLDLPESEEYNTLAGYILEHLEELPVEGSCFEIGDLRFTVLQRSATKLELIKVERRQN